MKTCMTCGMPLEGDHAADLAFETPEGFVCKFDSENGQIKSAAEIYAGGVAFFQGAVAQGDQALAERLTRKNMKALAYWQRHPDAVLDGEEATEEEYMAAMAKL